MLCYKKETQKEKTRMFEHTFIYLFLQRLEGICFVQTVSEQTPLNITFYMQNLID